MMAMSPSPRGWGFRSRWPGIPLVGHLLGRRCKDLRRLRPHTGFSTVLGLEPRSASNPAIRTLRATAGWPAPPLFACPFPRGRGSRRCSVQGEGGDDHSRSHGRPLGTWHYYVPFEDPDGIRLEVNFVPGAGLLADGAQFNPGMD